MSEEKEIQLKKHEAERFENVSAICTIVLCPVSNDFKLALYPNNDFLKKPQLSYHTSYDYIKACWVYIYY